MLKPVTHRNITEQVYEQLRDMIYRGELGSGERLQSERDLAALFKVGRPTVRGAIQRLIHQGLIEARRGVGTFVIDQGRVTEKRPLLQVLNNETFSIADFQEARMALESKSAELAAQRATDEDLRMIRRCLERIGRERDDDLIDIRTDITFHMNIAYASKNNVQIHLMKSIYDVQQYAMTYSYKTLFSNLGLGELIDRQHRRIFDAISDHDPKGAREATEIHIGTILETCREHGL